MARAVWNNTIIAESESYVVLEGNVYFPSDSVKHEYLSPNSHTSFCFWKGKAHYFDVNVSGKASIEAAWSYPSPSPAAKIIKGYFAFWRGVKVER